MGMVGGVYKRITEVHRGTRTARKQIEYLLWDKETGEEKVFQHGIDAREHLHVEPDKWSMSPPDGHRPNLHTVVHLEEDEPEQVSLPDVDGSMTKGREELVTSTPIPTTQGLTLARKKKPKGA